MEIDVLINISSIVVIGIVAQWLAWRFELPSILLLLLFGIVAGPVTGFLQPDQMMGELLFPFVSLAVGIILFEGGLNLRFAELPGVRGVIISLISVGVVVTWVIASCAAKYILGLDSSIALLLGAILTVSGPTVIIPILRDVRLRGRLGSILKWEGILIDPVGAIFAVLVFEAILLEGTGSATSYLSLEVVKVIGVGILFGFGAAMLLTVLLKRFWVPDFLENAVSLMIVVGAFTISHILQRESGLLTVTIMGVVLANTKGLVVKHILEFKESLRVLFISFLFIILAARLSPSDLEYLDLKSLLFLLVLIVIARPLSVFISTMRSGLSMRERIFLSWISPRGIVAAAVSSIFALELAHYGFPGAELLVPYTFLIIIGTVLIVSLTAKPFAKFLRLVQTNPQGALIVGAHKFSRSIAKALQMRGVRVLLVDSNLRNISAAKREGLSTQHGNILTESVFEDIELDGIGRMLAMTPNEEANALAALRFVDTFSRAEVYQLPPAKRDSESDGIEQAHHLRGRLLFGKDDDFYSLEERFYDGGEIITTLISEEDSFEKFAEQVENNFLPLFVVTEERDLLIYSADREPKPRVGQYLISLVYK